MEDKLKDLAVSVGIVATGIFARIKFDNTHKYTTMQIVALWGVGIAIIAMLNETNFNRVTVMGITLFYGLVSPSVLRAIIKGGEKSEDKAADKISEKIDKFS